MDKTKSKLAAFFDNDEDDPFPQKAVDDHKVSAYTQGTVRKSRREKEKEAAEAKKREEEENAARAYAEFIDAFEGEDVGRRKSGSAFVKADSGTTYAPSLKSKAEGSSRGPTRAFGQDDFKTPSPPPVSRPKGKRAMDAFLEEIKRDQAEREARYSRRANGRSVTALAAYEGQSGSKDRGDPETTNIFVANLPPHVTEQSLGTFFARCGPVGSVKIMWPRGDNTIGPGADMTASRRNRNAGLSGFVSFMKRKDAEAAFRELDGFDWGGSVLRVGWSKAVPVASKPMYGKPPFNEADLPYIKPQQVATVGLPLSLAIEGQRSRPLLSALSQSVEELQQEPFEGAPPISVAVPQSLSPYERDRRLASDEEDPVTDQFIRNVATEVRGHGGKYEETLKEREKHNPKYAFLVNKNHRKNRYYRSLLKKGEDSEPEFNDDGYNSVYSTDSAEESERENGNKNRLGKLARRRFEAMLRALTGRRGELARCMAFSLDHAEAAADVADIIVSSLLVDGTPVPRKVARLHLICDILHNSAVPVPGAWKFRQEFLSRLGLVFDHLSTIYHSFPGRITAETFKKQITTIVDIWDDWMLFPGDFTAGLRARLEGTTLEGEEPKEERSASIGEEKRDVAVPVPKFKTNAFKPAEAPATEPAGAPDSDGEPMDEGSDVDGAPIDDDVDGVPIEDDVDGVPMDDVDGEPLAEDVDGEPMEDDVDGQPIEI
ncbi:hypothetical protein GLOTRDRAFT_127735 [Gloeophyllum trabeum ATCC 11539]|uniref:RNA-binding domain-containing protein n=1 Tax=Gloeophyllum trabeum (strain ATCC 11539 / FP-39264 / Madison 617) TaxID=670483 RepID=S7QDI2_GLOTA|nr:uncharacterized protein GLOTRDRAFT_127735 [Gloeophyllum trabeum ATCC 11539]EPQ57387.1 hypothetical protein GLOTRDRAFT_127735 [Gloeophyllum trabeum ATCC 11539]